MPKTLIHNDFNPRNICLRRRDGTLELCAYDWELATMHLPQHDLAELLCFVLTPEVDKGVVDHYVDFHRSALEKAVGHKIDHQQWRTGYRYSLYDLAANRFALYVMAHTFRHYPFMERVVRTLRHLIYLETDKNEKMILELERLREQGMIREAEKLQAEIENALASCL